MWAYNGMLKCAVNGSGRISNLLFAWQKSSSLSRSFVSTAPLQKLFLSAQRPSVLTSVFRPSVQRQLLKKDFHVSKCVRSDTSTNLAKDVVLFKYDNVRLHKIITLFGCVNFAMFMVISINIYTLLTKQEPSEGEEHSEFDSETNENSSVSSRIPRPIYPETSASPLSEDTSAEESKSPIPSSYILAALCGVTFAMGYAVLFGTWVYCNHVVRYIVLHKCGKKVTVVTHGAFGKNRYRTWNLDQVNVRGNRTISSSVLLGAKNKFFSYILDIKGTYTNPKLFDATVGVPRDIRTRK